MSDLLILTASILGHGLIGWLWVRHHTAGLSGGALAKTGGDRL